MMWQSPKQRRDGLKTEINHLYDETINLGREGLHDRDVIEGAIAYAKINAVGDDLIEDGIIKLVLEIKESRKLDLSAQGAQPTLLGIQGMLAFMGEGITVAAEHLNGEMLSTLDDIKRNNIDRAQKRAEREIRVNDGLRAQLDERDRRLALPPGTSSLRDILS